MSRTPANQQASLSSSSNAKSSSGASSAAAAPQKVNGASSASSSAGAASNNLSSSNNPSPGPAASNWAKIAAGANNRAPPAGTPPAASQNASQQPLNPSGPAGRGSSGNRQPSASAAPVQASAAQNKKASAADAAATASSNKAAPGKNVAPSAASSVKFGNASDASSLASSTPAQASTPASSVSGKNMSFGSLPATQASSAAGTPGRNSPSGSANNASKAVETASAAPPAAAAPTFDPASLDMNSFFQGGGGSPEASPTKETANAAPSASSGRLAAPQTQTLHSSSPASANANQQPPSSASSRRASTYDNATTAAMSPRNMAAQLPMQGTPHQQQFMQGGARPFSPSASSNLGKSGQPMPQGYPGYPGAGLPQTPSFASSGYGSPAQAGFVPNSPYSKPNGIVMNGGQPGGPNQQRNQQGGPASQQTPQQQAQGPYINRQPSGLGHQHTRSLQAQSPRIAPAQAAGMPYYQQQGYPQPAYGQYPGGYYGYAPQGAYPPQYYQQGQQAPGSQHRPSMLQQHSSQSGMSTPSSPAPSMRPSLSTTGSGSFTPGASTTTQSGDPTHSSATTPAPSAVIASPTPSHASIPSAHFRHPSTPSHVHTPSFGQSMHHGPSTPSHFTPSSAHAPAFTPSSMSSPPPTAGLNAGAPTFSFGPPRQMAGVSIAKPVSKAIAIKKPPPKDAAPADKEKDKPATETSDKAAQDKKDADALKAAEEKKAADEKAAKEKAETEAKAAEEKVAADAAAEKAKKKQEDKEQKEREEREKQELDEQLRQQEAEAKRVREEKEAEEKAAKEKEESDKAKAQEEEAARQAAEAEQKRIEEAAAQSKADESNKDQAQPSTPSAPLTREPSQTSADDSSVPASSSNDINAPSATKRTAPEPLDLSAAAKHGVSSDSIVAPGSALSQARRIEDLSVVPYPDSVRSPQPALNAKAKPGKFRYDRDFLLQFMAVCKEKPEQLPSLEAIGMTDEGSGGAGGVPIPRSASYGGKSRQGSVPSTPLAGRGPPNFNRAVSTGFAGMGNFSGVPATGLTSEQRFAQATANAGGLPGRPGSMARTPSAAGGFGGGIPMGGSSGRGADRSSGRGSRRPQGRAPPSAPTIPASDLVPLEMSENRWTPSVQAGGSSRNAAQDETAPEFVERKVKALLNKLTIENFDSISKQILAWADKSVQEQDGRILKQVIALIFEKATDEQTWSEVYAKLCLFLSAKVSAEVTDHSLLEANGQPATGGRLFRRYLLTRCQQDYEKGWAQKESATAAAKSKAADDKAKRETAEKEGEAAGVDKETAVKGVDFSDEYYAAEKAKRRGLGLVRFIGELYRIQMLKEKIMHECIKKLIANVDTPEEEDIESLCKLLLTVGRQLDEGKDTSAKYMNIYFERLKQIVANHCVPSRLEFMILDLMDTRKNGWKQRAGPAGPKSIADIHKDNVREKEEESRRTASQGRGLPPRNMGMERGGSRRGQGREGPGPDGWQAAQAAPRPQARAGDLSQLGKIRSTSGSPALAPGYVRGQGKQAVKEAAPAGPSNPFALLDEGAAEPLSPPAAEDKPQRVPLKLKPRTVSGTEDATEAPAAAEDEAEGEAEEGEVVEEASGEMDEATKRSIENSVKEYLGVRNIEEGKATFSDLPEQHRGELVKAFIVKVVDGKAADVDAVVNLFEAVASASIVPAAMFREAFVPTVTDLEDIATDAPKAYSNTANLMAAADLSDEDFAILQQSMVSNEENLEGIQEDFKSAWEKANSSS